MSCSTSSFCFLLAARAGRPDCGGESHSKSDTRRSDNREWRVMGSNCLAEISLDASTLCVSCAAPSFSRRDARRRMTCKLWSLPKRVFPCSLRSTLVVYLPTWSQLGRCFLALTWLWDIGWRFSTVGSCWAHQLRPRHGAIAHSSIDASPQQRCVIYSLVPVDEIPHLL
jgi:hypothetical protein